MWLNKRRAKTVRSDKARRLARPPSKRTPKSLRAAKTPKDASLSAFLYSTTFALRRTRILGVAEKLENSRKSEKNVKIESLREFSSSPKNMRFLDSASKSGCFQQALF
jgi:hypothetical protein